MWRQLRGSVLMLAAAVLLLGQGATPLENPRVRRLGDQLVCLCGCGSSVTQCNMLHCEFSEPARQKLLKMVNAGMTDSDILAAFVKEYGQRVLMKPPSEGFNLLGWLMPFIALAAGLALVWWLIRRFRAPLAVAGPEPDPALLARIEKETDELDS
ncbi:MAG: cytochrome c-type biogenesis protein CcmH [Bryobacteraceae bacterium]